jgi:hypothetical protein
MPVHREDTTSGNTLHVEVHVVTPDVGRTSNCSSARAHVAAYRFQAIAGACSGGTRRGRSNAARQGRKPASIKAGLQEWSPTFALDLVEGTPGSAQ